jgi:hypothetical protein
MWKTRSPPTSLDFDAISDGTFQSQNNRMSENDYGSKSVNGHAAGSNQPPVLKDQRALTLKDNLDLFVSRYHFVVTGICPVLIRHEARTVLPPACAMARKRSRSIKMTMTH